MSSNLVGRLLLTSAALALSGCIGGGDINFAPTPTPTPTPTPAPPPPAQSPAIFPNITTSTTFAALGLEASSRNIAASSLVGTGFSARYDATSNAYIIGLPTQAPGTFVGDPDGRGPGFWVGNIQGTIFDDVSIATSTPNNQLAYTSIGDADGYYTSALSFFAFGSATPPSGMPVSGSATYIADVFGTTLDSDPSHFPTKTIGGTATLQFDFGAGTLAGHFDPVLNVLGPSNSVIATNLGSYNFVNTVYAAGKTDFSGQLSISGASSPGAFDGQFTGPAAQELMARWTAPYLIPGSQQWSQMFGVWVGKKH